MLTKVQIDDIEAQIAAMRRVLDRCYDLRFKLGWADSTIVNEIYQALSGEAGKALLESLEAAGLELNRQDVLLFDLQDELALARSRFDAFHSDSHPGKFSPEDTQRMRAEAIQVAAMACRFVLDTCDHDE